MSNVLLSKVLLPRDIGFLYKCMNGEDQYLFSTKMLFDSVQHFESWINDRIGRDFHDFYIISICKVSGQKETVGYVHNYEFSLLDGHCKIAIYVIPEYRETGVGAMATALFIQTLFREYPFRKVYSWVYDYNRSSLESSLQAGFFEEGEIEGYRYYNGSYNSVHCLVMTREKFETVLCSLPALAKGEKSDNY